MSFFIAFLSFLRSFILLTDHHSGDGEKKANNGKRLHGYFDDLDFYGRETARYTLSFKRKKENDFINFSSHVVGHQDDDNNDNNTQNKKRKIIIITLIIIMIIVTIMIKIM